ncbi:unnamed protein product, partial [Effrenium voratum]
RKLSNIVTQRLPNDAADMEPEPEREQLPAFTAQDVQDAYEQWETKPRDDKIQFLLSIPMQKDSYLKKNEAAMRAILVKAETDPDEWVQRLALLLASFIGTTTVASSEIDKQFMFALSREVRKLRVLENAMIPEVLELVTPGPEEEEYQRQCSSPLAPAPISDTTLAKEPEAALWFVEDARKQMATLEAIELFDSKKQEPEQKRPRADPFQTWREVSRPQAVRSSGAGSSHDLGTFTAADIREKWLKEQKVICIM